MSTTPPGYWIAHVSILDEKAYAEYKRLAGEAITAHGGKFLARGGRYQQIEGRGRAWNTVASFPSFEAALSCYHSAEYAAALEIAAGAIERDLVIVEGQ